MSIQDDKENVNTFSEKNQKNFPVSETGRRPGTDQSWWLKFFRWLTMMSAKSWPVVGGV